MCKSCDENNLDWLITESTIPSIYLLTNRVKPGIGKVPWRQMCIPRNAANESFFSTLKTEFFRFTEFDSIEQLDAGLHEHSLLQPWADKAQIERIESGRL